jgi:hypothetical protein
MSLLLMSLIACDGGGVVLTVDTDTTDTSETGDPITGPQTINLHINELMAENRESLVLEDASSPDWVELYNASDVDLDLDGFMLRDDLAEGEPSVINGTLVVPAGGFVVLYADGGSGVDHLDFKLNSAGEELGIYTPDDQPIDLLQFGQQVRDMALARAEDGVEDTWTYVSMGTPGESNE